jgi:uncharacterized repeat protein (TIGR01451 family)
MKPKLLIVAVLVLFFCSAAQAEQHRATHLGNPATRFAPPLNVPDDLRSRFRDEKLLPDIASVLHQWGWPGNLNDLRSAALTNEITEVKIPAGTVMPFMSSREEGKPICLRNVTWAGAEPISAYSFTFSSRDHRYRCVTPKPCSNFFIVDLGPEPKPVLALDCSVPDNMPVGRPVQVCLTLRNTGDALESRSVITLSIPETSTLTRLTEGGVVAKGFVTWQVERLAPNSAKKFCGVFTTRQTSPLSFKSRATGTIAKPVETACDTTVFGIPAILLEKADEPDPVSIGSTTTYTVKVTNQGTADDLNVQVVVTVAPELVPESCSEGSIVGQTVTLPLVPKLESKETVSYSIVARGVSPGDGHTKFVLSSEALKSPIIAEESTTVY